MFTRIFALALCFTPAASTYDPLANGFKYGNLKVQLPNFMDASATDWTVTGSRNYYTFNRAKVEFDPLNQITPISVDFSNDGISFTGQYNGASYQTYLSIWNKYAANYNEQYRIASGTSSDYYSQSLYGLIGDGSEIPFMYYSYPSQHHYLGYQYYYPYYTRWIVKDYNGGKVIYQYGLEQFGYIGSRCGKLIFTTDPNYMFIWSSTEAGQPSVWHHMQFDWFVSDSQCPEEYLQISGINQTFSYTTVMLMIVGLAVVSFTSMFVGTLLMPTFALLNIISIPLIIQAAINSIVMTVIPIAVPYFLMTEYVIPMISPFI